MDKWDACPPLPTDEDLAKRPCWAGLDLSATADLTALAVAWPCADGVVAVRVWHWIPEARARRKEKEDRVPYLTWAEQGHIELTPGDVVDYQYIRKRINEIAKAHKLKDVGTDPWNATQITTELVEQDGIKVIEFRQGCVSMSSPCKEIERLVMSGKLAHGNNPLLRWQVSHAVVRTDPAGNIKLDKEKATQRIDGMVAVAMAIGRLSVGAASNKVSVYETREVRFI
jgi:phage terminase large subunit-like protein